MTKKDRGQTLLLLAASLLLGLGLCEAALRIAGYAYTPLEIQAQQDSGDERRQHVFEDRHFIYDPELIWAPRRGVGVFNRDGYRGAPVDRPKPAGELRVLALGDSNTLGWAGSDGANWPGYLENELRRVGRRPRVINAGVWGYASLQGLRRLRQYLSLEPDLVLISFGSNDAHAVRIADRDFVAHRERRKGIETYLMTLRLGQLALAVAERLSGGDTAGEMRRRVSLEDYRANLAAMIALARGSGARVVFLTRPYIGESRDGLWWKNKGAAYNAATVEVAGAAGAPVIDLYTFFKDRPELFADESHFTEEGHRLAAAIVFRHLLPLVVP